MYDRDLKTAMGRARTAIGSRSHVSVSYLWKEFGANNFYGGNAPSREWTNQTLVAADHRLGAAGAWNVDLAASYRTHGDRFVFNQERPLVSDNRHRTHAALGSLKASRRVGAAASLTAGIEGGGDWIRSSNLGDHDVARVSGFGEWRQDVGSRTVFDATLRVDRYSEFGASWSPSAGVGWSPTGVVRLRGSAGRAFRVPTFTERFYSDPANLARAEVGPERAWAGEGGVDLFLPRGWWAQTTVFGRADRDVIDWLRPTVADRWRTYNIRDVNTVGVEVGARKTFPGGAFVHGAYTALDVDAASVNQLSKYVLDFASRSFVASALVSLPGALRIAPRVEYRRRVRSSGTFNYVLVDARIAKRVNRLVDVLVDGTNLLDRSYQEIAGVAMPGAAFSVSLAVGAR
jgi:iron complex outermembrane receptor protein